MKKINHILFLGILMIALITPSIAQNWAWAKSAGGHQKVESYAIAVDKFGNSYITGWFEDTLTIGNTTLAATITNNSFASDVFIAKYDINGNFKWAKRAGGANYDFGNGITTDASGNVYVIGGFSLTATFGTHSVTSSGDYDVFIAKYDSNGNNLWVKRCGGTGWDVGNGITVDKSGNCYVTGGYISIGTFGTTTLTSLGNYDAFVAKYDSTGTFLWAKSAGGVSEDMGQSLSTDAANNCYVIGYFNGTATIGITPLTSAGSSDIWIAKYDASGNSVWAKKAGGSLEDKGLSIASDPSGNMYLTGYFNGAALFGTGLDTITKVSAGGADIFAGKYDYKGDVKWMSSFGGAMDDKGYGISIDSLGHSYVAGSFFNTAHFDTITAVSVNQDDAFVAGLNNLGTAKWVAHGGGLNSDLGRGVAASKTGVCYTTGYFGTSATFGNYTIQGFSTTDNSLFIAKVDSVMIINGINEDALNLNGLVIYPNPSDSDVTVQFETTALNEQIHVELYDILGKAVTDKVTISKIKNIYNKKQVVINRKGLPDGLYLIKVSTGNKIYSTRLMLVK